MIKCLFRSSFRPCSMLIICWPGITSRNAICYGAVSFPMVMKGGNSWTWMVKGKNTWSMHFDSGKSVFIHCILAVLTVFYKGLIFLKEVCLRFHFWARRSNSFPPSKPREFHKFSMSFFVKISASSVQDLSDLYVNYMVMMHRWMHKQLLIWSI